MREITEALLSVLASGGRGALATVVRTSGSTPLKAGARLLLRPDDTVVGTVGGGAVEHRVLETLQRVRQRGVAELVKHELGYDLGMCCGGRMEVFVEPVESTPRLFLVGAGHVAKPTAALVRTLGFDVVVVDERDELCTAERFPGCRLEVGDPATFMAAQGLGDRDWVLIVTHDHRLDEEVLERVLRQRPRYVGLVGSQRKALVMTTRLRAKRGDALHFDRLFAPVGLDLGAQGPEEIAVSIAAELVALRRGKAADHMRVVAGEATDDEERQPSHPEHGV